MKIKTVTHICGHEEDHKIFARVGEVDEKIALLAAMRCWECRREELEKERDAQAEKAREEAAEIGLPELEGTKKQIRWAHQLRGEFLAKIEALRGDESPTGNAGYEKNALAHILSSVRESHSLREARAAGLVAPTGNIAEAMTAQFRVLSYQAALEWCAEISNASYWIDTREEPLHGFASEQRDELTAIFIGCATGQSVGEVLDNQQRIIEEKKIAEEEKEQAKRDATLYPETLATNTVAEITIAEFSVRVKFPERRDDVREMLRDLGYGWVSTIWEKDTRVLRGNADRAAEVAACLLKLGIPVRCFDGEVRRRAVAGEYSREPKVWIFARDGKFFIEWKRSVDFYETARGIKGSRYSKPAVVVPADKYDIVADFAERHGCALLDSAQKLISSQREAFLARITVEPEDAPETPEPVLETRRPVLDDGHVAVPDSLRDDD